MESGRSPSFSEKFELPTSGHHRRILIEVRVVSLHHKSSVIGGMSFGLHSIHRQPASGWFYILDQSMAPEKHMRVRCRQSKIPTRQSQSRFHRLPLRPYTSSPTLATGLLSPPARLTRSATDGNIFNKTFTISPQSVRTPREQLRDIHEKPLIDYNSSQEFPECGCESLKSHRAQECEWNSSRQSTIGSRNYNCTALDSRGRQLSQDASRDTSATTSQDPLGTTDRSQFAVRILNDTNAIRHHQGSYSYNSDIFTPITSPSGHISASTPASVPVHPSSTPRVSHGEASRDSMTPELLSISLLDGTGHLADGHFSDADKRKGIYSGDETALDSWLASPTWQRILDHSGESKPYRGIIV